MLELRYNTITKEPTGWCKDETEFGGLKDRGNEAIIILDIPMPTNDILSYLVDNGGLVDNPNYVEPKPLRNLTAEIDELKEQIKRIEGG